MSADDPPAYLSEFNQLTLARLLVAQHRADPDAATIEDALALLDRLLSDAEAGERAGSLAETLALRALAHHARGDDDLALGDLGRALELGVPAGYRRLFLDEGPAMDELLRLAGRSPSPSVHIDALLKPARGGRTPAAPPPSEEALSERELEVVRLLATELTGPEIAQRLFVSVNTLRTHTKHIFTKLDVNTRRSAVRRASELGLL